MVSVILYGCARNKRKKHEKHEGTIFWDSVQSKALYRLRHFRRPPASKTSDVTVAISKDEKAPVFKVANYGIAGDLYDVIPVMIEEFGKVFAER